MVLDSELLQAHATLDVRATKCPLNFVKTRLALDKLQPGQILAVQVDASQDSAINIPQSVLQDGHCVIATTLDPHDTTTQTLWIQKKAL